MLQPLHSMPWLARARELMRFVREFHHHRRHFPELQGPEHLFAAGTGRRPGIGLTQDEHHRRLHFLYISDRRARLEVFRIIEWRGLEPARLKESEVGRVPPISPAG